MQEIDFKRDAFIEYPGEGTIHRTLFYAFNKVGKDPVMLSASLYRIVEEIKAALPPASLFIWRDRPDMITTRDGFNLYARFGVEPPADDVISLAFLHEETVNQAFIYHPSEKS